MIRVLIAEDEPPIARAISRMIEELSPAFKVIGCEINGRDALEHIRREPVDLVFTDIRMPIMDGLKLLDVLHTEFPDCLTVILSGHQDFTYAQTALRLGAFDYLLKPVSRDKLSDLLRQLENAHTHSLLHEVVTSWRAGKDPMTARPTLSKRASYAMILAFAGHWPAIPDDALSPGAVFWQTHDPAPLIQNLLSQEHSITTFVGRAAAERVFLLENMTPFQTSALARDLFALLTKLSTLPKTLCVMPGPLGFADIGPSIRAARIQVYTRIGLCRSALFNRLETTESQQAKERIPFVLLPEQLTDALCLRKEEQIAAAVDAAVDTAVSNGMTQIAFERFLETVIYDRRLSYEVKALKEELFEAILGAVSPAGLKADMKQIFSQYTLGESKVEQRDLIGRIERYLSAHYAESISSEMLSARFGFVPSYLSKLFRRYTGMSPTEYLTKLRVEKARALLESQSGLLVRDVALLVGFSDPHNFSKLFKKVTGQWPSQVQGGNLQ